MSDYAKGLLIPHITEEPMAQYRIYKRPDGLYSLSATLRVGDEHVAYLTEVKIEKRELWAKATKMAEDIGVRRVAFRAVRVDASKAGVTG